MSPKRLERCVKAVKGKKGVDSADVICATATKPKKAKEGRKR